MTDREKEIRENMLAEHAAEVGRRLATGATLTAALEPLLGMVALDLFTAVVNGEAVTLGLLLDTLTDTFTVAVSTEYEADGETPVWVPRVQSGELAEAYGVYLAGKKGITCPEEGEEMLAELLGGSNMEG